MSGELGYFEHDEFEAVEASKQRSAECLREAARIVLFKEGITVSDKTHKLLNRKDPAPAVGVLDRLYPGISEDIYQEAEAQYEQHRGISTSA